MDAVILIFLATPSDNYAFGYFMTIKKSRDLVGKLKKSDPYKILISSSPVEFHIPI